MIVGRDPESLDEAGVSRAAIESCAENFSDGVVAPAFWFALLGLPGLIAYKAVNTANSMIGHRTARHEAFGWAAARLDDLLNLVPARLSGPADRAGGAVVRRQDRRGAARRCCATRACIARPMPAGRRARWPAALGVALAGPRRYGRHVVSTIRSSTPEGRAATPADIARALRVLVGACVLHAALYAALALAL